MNISQQILRAAVVLAVSASAAQAEDIDLFVGTAATSANPNVLVIIDNSANWSTASQHWIGGVKQGQSELRALRKVVGEMDPNKANVNFGLMMFTEKKTSTDFDGGYIRFHLRPMNATNIGAFQELIGPDTNCVDAENSLTGAPNCIFKNYDTSFEKTGTNQTVYSAALFEAFKYFGGFTSPQYAHRDPAVAGSPTDKTHFGPTRYAGSVPSDTSDPEYKKFDKDAFTDATKTTYANWNGIACANNYIIFIGNGFPVSDTPASLLSGVEGSTAQLPMLAYTTTSVPVTEEIGTDAVCESRNACGNRAATLFPGLYETYSCLDNGSQCQGGQLNRTMQGTYTKYTVKPTGTPTLPSSNDARFTDEWAQYLYTTDVSDLPGPQNIVINTIDVFRDAPDARQTALLKNMADVGGGEYYQASSEDDIVNALRKILINIQSVNSVFAAASLPINATNRSQNENQVFIGMFRPDSGAKPRWYGNLKRYKVGLFGGEVKLADADGRDAVAGAFLDACARSFWTTDSGSYWTFSQISAGTCTTAGTTKVFSDSPDGPLVEKGATAEVVRKGNDPAAPTEAVNRNIYTCYFPASLDYCRRGTNGTLTPFDTGKDANGYNHVWSGATQPWWDGYTATAAEHEQIIKFSRGMDTGNEDNDLLTTDTRPSLHGDVAHSRPLPVNYGGGIGVVLYYGANDGTFRAVSGTTGQELWAFIAPEHHPRLRRLMLNSPLIMYPNMTDPLPVPTPQRKDYFFDGSAGLFQNADNSLVWVFPTMRRGGNMLQAFDVTHPVVTDTTGPSIKWRQGCFSVPYTSSSYNPTLAADTKNTILNKGYVETADGYFCSPGFENIGQTWGTPAVALIKGYAADLNNPDPNKPLVIVGGGYDTCEDVDSMTTTCTAPRGRNVYIIDGDTGTLVKKFGVGGTGTIERSVASDITLVDRNFDGYADHGYFVDTGGALYRIDFVDPANLTPLAVNDWKLTKLAYTTGGGRKFLFAPAALPAAGKVYLTFGSGDRERPLITNYPYVQSVQNRFYMFIDIFEVPVAPATTVSPIDLDSDALDNFTNTNDLGCSVRTSADSRGWFFDLNQGRGEQTVTSSTIFGGLVFFSTNYPEPPTEGSCNTKLGKAPGYAVNLLNASGAVGTAALCGGTRSALFAGGGLPPSPVTGTVPVDGVPVTIMIGGVNRKNPGQSSAIQTGQITPPITQRRSRIYWYQHGDKQ